MEDVSLPEESLSESGISEKEDVIILEAVVWDCASWPINADIELDAYLVIGVDDVCSGFDLKIYEWDTGWQKEVDVIFDKFLNSQFKIIRIIANC